MTLLCHNTWQLAKQLANSFLAVSRLINDFSSPHLKNQLISILYACANVKTTSRLHLTYTADLYQRQGYIWRFYDTDTDVLVMLEIESLNECRRKADSVFRLLLIISQPSNLEWTTTANTNTAIDWSHHQMNKTGHSAVHLPYPTMVRKELHELTYSINCLHPAKVTIPVWEPQLNWANTGIHWVRSSTWLYLQAKADLAWLVGMS